MHSRIRLFIPLGLLFCGCIDVPPIETPPVENPQPDAGVQGDFSLTVAPTRASLFQGKSQTLQLSLTRQGNFSGSVSVSAVNAPAGVSVLPTTIPAGSTSVNLEVVVAESATPGTQVLTLRATAGALSHDTAFELTVVKLGDLLVSWASPSLDKLYANGQLPLQVTVEGGTADYVEVLKGQTVLKRLSTLPYQFTWDTTQESEGAYSLMVRAVRGSGSFTSTTKDVVVDRTAPAVASKVPAVDASTVSVHDPIQVNFSEAMNSATAKDSSIVVSAGSTNIAKSLSWSADGKTLTVSPLAPLPIQSTITVALGTVAEPLMDLANNALPPLTSWTFSVPTWLPMGGALSALPGNTPAENVTMKIGTDGSPVVAWSEYDGTANRIYVRRWTGSTWQPVGESLKALTGANVNANNPSLVLDGSNQPVTMWSEGADNLHSSLYGARWDGTNWNSLPGMPPPPQVNGYSGLGMPSLVVDGKGLMSVAAESYSEGVASVQGFQLGSVQDGWVSTAPKAADVAQSSGIVLTVNGSGTVFAAYLGSVVTDSEIYWGIVAQRLETWGAWSRIGSPIRSSNSANGTHIATDGLGNPVVAWIDTASTTSTDTRVYAAWWVDGAWKQLGDVAGNQSTLNSRPFVLLGKDGKPLIAWSGYSSPERSIRVARWDGSSWQLLGAPLSALSGSSTAASKPVMALDKNGQPLVAWHESDGSVSNVYVYRYNY